MALENIQLAEDDISLEEGIVLSDSSKMWSRDISKYPLLSVEEEKEVGRDLKLDIGILYTNSIINLNRVFLLLESSIYSDTIINILYGLFSSINTESNKDILNKIERYISIKNKLGRCLNKEELLNYFNIKGDYFIDDNAFLRDINNYVKYMYAREKMACSNLRLVSSIASDYSYKYKLEFLDLVTEGAIGLITAVERFDVDKGFRFSTFGTWWIRQRILRYMSNNYSDLKVPNAFYSEVKEFKKMVSSLEEQKGRQLSIEEIVEITGMDRTDVMDYIYYQPKTVSLDIPVGDEDDTSTLGDFLPGKDDGTIDELNRQELNDSILEALEFLSKDEKQAIILYFGIDTGEARTLQEVGKEMKKTPKRVNIIVNNALKKLRILSTRKEEVQRLKLFYKE